MSKAIGAEQQLTGWFGIGQMDQPDMKQIEQRLAAVLKKERRDAICYALLTVLCTPFFVVLISLAVMIMVAYIYQYADLDISARTFYTCLTLFLATMATFVRWDSHPTEGLVLFDLTWLAGVGVLLLLVYVTFATSLIETKPNTFAILYTVAGFITLVLFGRVYMKSPLTEDVDSEDPYRSLPLVIFGFVAMAYGEIASGSWLWIPPDEDDIRVAAWILCKLALEDQWSLDSRSAERPILNLLFRLKYIQIKDGKLQLTYRGYSFVTAANEEEYAVE